MEQLSRHSLSTHHLTDSNGIPDPVMFHLPEKVLQFGTGVLLRALPDFYIDQANRSGLFNGRIVLVRSTNGSNADFTQQDNLYTVCVRGQENGALVKKNYINTSISRVLSANNEWDAILQVAKSESLELILSNTTEVGIRYVPEFIGASAPSSYPAKLLAVLKTRFDHFNGAVSAGLIIIPTELITDNARQLQQILIDLARHNNYEARFIQWISEANRFCNSLVDRIVPGKPDGEELELLYKELGYRDELLTKAEPFTLWAIEGDASIDAKLSFASIHPGMVICNDIQAYKELKLRFLNGSHSLCCALACLMGIKYTREFLRDEQGKAFLIRLMMEEILHAIPMDLPEQMKREYALSVVDRFANPFIDHQWLSISFQYTSKLTMRVLPLLKQFASRNQLAPDCISFGFACYILFSKPVKKQDENYWGGSEDDLYEIKDEAVATLYELWQKDSEVEVVHSILSKIEFWGMDLHSIPGFAEKVWQYIHQIQVNGIRLSLQSLLNLQ